VVRKLNNENHEFRGGRAALAILAGGEGSRMGIPKGELVINGGPILQYLLDRFAWDGPTLLVTAPGREHPPGWNRFTREVVDPVGRQGPLRGVLTALENSNAAQVLVTTVDMPGLHARHLRWLFDRSRAVITMLERGDRVEPFPSVFQIGAGSIIREQMSAGELSVQALSHQAAVEVLPAPSDWDDDAWTNLNRPEELDAFLKRLSRSSRADR
jgi:molybdopterin-guanine dinucleotide biosynthesis protein A